MSIIPNERHLTSKTFEPDVAADLVNKRAAEALRTIATYLEHDATTADVEQRELALAAAVLRDRAGKFDNPPPTKPTSTCRTA